MISPPCQWEPPWRQLPWSACQAEQQKALDEAARYRASLTVDEANSACGPQRLPPFTGANTTDFVPGRTFYDLRRAPSHDELTGIIAQVVRIHALDTNPAFVFDPWAITNLVPLGEQVQGFLDTEQRHLLARVLDEVAAVDGGTLPAALIHADLTKGNVLLAEDGLLTVLDFAVANRLPRVQELAVIAANLCHGSPDPLPARGETIADLYSTAAPAPLTVTEVAALRIFTRAAAAMELLGALAEWHCHGNHSRETEYLIDLGLAGLRDYAALS